VNLEQNEHDTTRQQKYLHSGDDKRGEPSRHQYTLPGSCRQGLHCLELTRNMRNSSWPESCEKMRRCRRSIWMSWNLQCYRLPGREQPFQHLFYLSVVYALYSLSIYDWKQCLGSAYNTSYTPYRPN
jgi:hypothetical protein